MLLPVLPPALRIRTGVASGLLATCGLALLVVMAGSRAAAEPLPPPAAELLQESMLIADARWDARAHLLWNSADETRRSVHSVRQSAWYVLGLMARDGAGDRDRALATLRAVLRQQIDEPGQAWDGTFYRSPEEPRPQPGARMWQDYDPNWRQFIGTAFALLLIEFEDRLPPADRQAIEECIRRSVEGELAEGRLQPSYTNIAVMHGFLLAYAGTRLGRPEWIRAGEAWMESVQREFAPHRSFDEYNSPTYYGVDLYGLALLRRHGPTAPLRTLGAAMEAALWEDIALFYHAGLRNLAGPFDRTYGMDLTRYVSLTGMWLRLAISPEAAPLPPVSQTMSHGNDFLFAPCFVLLGVELPAATRPHFSRFAGERRIERPIADGRRIATAWLGAEVMIGGEITAQSRGVTGPEHQFRPATIHWRAPDGTIAWAAVVRSPRLDARAGQNTLEIEATGNTTIRVHAPGLDPEQFTRTRWSLPGLEINVDSDALSFSVESGTDFIDLTFGQATRIRLQTRAGAPAS